MTRSVAVLVCLSAAMAFGGSTANSLTDSTSSTNGVVAYVYIANAPQYTPQSNGPNEITAYAADSSGRLTPVPGSPFQEDVVGLAVNGKYLMGPARTTTNVESYRIADNGSLKFAVATDYSGHNGMNCCAVGGPLFFDHTGSDLYLEGGGFVGANNGVYSFAVDKATGALDYLGQIDVGNFFDPEIEASFIGDNVYAYQASGGCLYPLVIPNDVFGFKRSSNGDLSLANGIKNTPAPPPGIRAYIAGFGVADRSGHVAFVEFPANPPACSSLPPQIVSYTAGSNGLLTTTNTYKNMPTTKITDPYDMKMAPSGDLVAVGGQQGLQVFHFNGTDAPTAYTGLLTTDPINQMAWDNDNHLYAIGTTGDTLHVFTITPTEHKEVSGSPYKIMTPESIIVQPWPL